MKIALLTNFNEFHPGYSLTGIVKDQARMLLRHGHEVHLFVNVNYNPKWDDDLPDSVHLRKEVPFTHLIDYNALNELTDEHKQYAEKTAQMLRGELSTFDIAITHDWVFQGWFMPHAIAVAKSTLALPDLRWLHWIHSVPCTNYDWSDMQRYGHRHKLVYPTQTERNRVAEQYRGTHADVRVVPHIKDIRSWYDFHVETWDFIDWCPGVLHADVVQVYPASADRLSAKQVDKVMRIFAGIKKQGFSVCLVIADQWATMRSKENEEPLKRLACAIGLSDDEFRFSSEFADKKYETGLPKRILRELQLCQNLFVFPTTQESFGLVGPEAALSGAYMVINRSLKNQGEIFEHMPMEFDFGAYDNTFEPGSWDDFLRAVSGVIVQRMRENESISTMSIIRRKFNMDTLYRKYYEPLFRESAEWLQKAR